MVGGSPGDDGGGTTTEREREREVATRGKLGESTLSRERERESQRGGGYKEKEEWSLKHWQIAN